MAYSMVVNTARRELSLYQDGVLARTYPVGIGKMVTPTPAGNYSIVSKMPNPGGPFGVMWLGLSKPHYGIHGTNNPASIGSYVSHGCIRMFNKDVLELARIVPVGTPVTVI